MWSIPHFSTNLSTVRIGRPHHKMTVFPSECTFYFLLFMAYCSGASLRSQTQPANAMDKAVKPNDNKLKVLFSLLNRTVIQNLIENHSNITQGPLATDQLNQLLAVGKPSSYPKQPTSTIIEDRFKEISNMSSGWQSSVTEVKLPDRQQESLSKPMKNITGSDSTKSPLEYQPQKPSFAGQFSNGQPVQLIPPGEPWPAEASSQVSLEDRLQETTPTTSSTTSGTMSPLEYHPQRPSFAGQFSSGYPVQLIPPGEPWPAEASSQVSLEDRLQETTPTTSSTTSGTMSPLEYHPQRPSFAGQFSSGYPVQLIPPGEPWPAEASSQVSLEDRLQETTPTTSSTTSGTMSPLEYHPQRPSFAGQFSSGYPVQLIPPGKPWPADPPTTKQPSLEDRFQEVDSNGPPGSGPFFAGSFSNGIPGQLIPPGKPWPADP